MIEIDGVPAHVVGAMIRKHCEAQAKKNEVAHCTGCRRDFPLDTMARPILFSEIHKGYKGLCLDCDRLKKEEEGKKSLQG